MRYINILAGIRFWGLMILIFALVLCGLIIGYFLISAEIDWYRKTKLLKSYGCERYLKGVPSVGNGAFYGWKTSNNKINIDERDIKNISYKHLKERLNNSK